jgi:5'-phosphate synthase pdxT subunit
LSKIRIGVFGLQGDIEEHLAMTQLALKTDGVEGESVWCKNQADIATIDGLIIPGGESTVIGGLARLNGTLQLIKEKAKTGMPVMGSCAGLITLANRVYDRVVGETHQPILGLLDVVVERNFFGRQRESFEAGLEIPVLGDMSFPGVFIRAPVIRDVGSDVKILSKLGDSVVMVESNQIIGTSFHPELTHDSRLHQYFARMIVKHKELA